MHITIYKVIKSAESCSLMIFFVYLNLPMPTDDVQYAKPCSIDMEQMTLLCFFVLSVCCNSYMYHVTACDPCVLNAFHFMYHLQCALELP